MLTINIEDSRNFIPESVADCRDCLQLLLMEYGDTHIDNLAQLFDLTSRVEIEFSHLCARRRT